MLKILVIDDDPLVQEAIGVMLRARGDAVTFAADGKSGIDAALTEAFDLVIVDLFLPGINGLKVIETMRRSAPRLPIIAASGFMFKGEPPTMPNFAPMAAEAGAMATLYKPFRPQALEKAIAQALAGNATEKAVISS
ncbi:MAG TPA: response regulator [Candidatus Binataceae bacterium]|nr:response regulator [Candidatus Binataceae bacterium]